jgi:c-di-GMP-binding flagellar brake protein YcgR
MREERRLHPRCQVRLVVDYRLEGFAEDRIGLTRDLSAGGAGLLTEEQIPSGSLLTRLRFSLSDGPQGEDRPIELSAVALRSVPLPAAEQKPYRFLAGLQFLNLQGEDFERLRIFVARALESS